MMEFLFFVGIYFTVGVLLIVPTLKQERWYQINIKKISDPPFPEDWKSLILSSIFLWPIWLIFGAGERIKYRRKSRIQKVGLVERIMRRIYNSKRGA